MSPTPTSDAAGTHLAGTEPRPGEVVLDGLTWRPLGRRVPVVADLDLTIEPGERVLLLGASGAGKSSVLHALTGALGGTIAGEVSGRVDVGGRLGLLPQDPSDAVVADRVGRDVAFGPENLGLPREEIWRRVDAALAAVRLPYGRDHPTVALSGGEQQRLALAGLLALEPDVMVLDEPTSMLDPATATAVRDAVLDVVDDRTLVVVEHRFEPWLEHVGRVVVLAAGHGPEPSSIVFDGPVDAFLAAARDAPAWSEPLWLPGAPDPEPLDVAAALVTPAGEVAAPVATGLEVELVTRSLRGERRSRAVDGLDVAARPGRRLALVGSSGAGKSTALAALGGLLRPSGGTVVPDLGRRRSAHLAPDVGWVPQNPEHAFVTTAVRDEVALTATTVGRTVDVDAVLATLHLDALAEQHPYRLSGGEQRRLALACGLAHRPGLLLLDEPTVGQDRRTWAAVAGWTQAAAEAGACVVVSTHDASLPVDDVVRLSRGRAAPQGGDVSTEPDRAVDVPPNERSSGGGSTAQVGDVHAVENSPPGGRRGVLLRANPLALATVGLAALVGALFVTDLRTGLVALAAYLVVGALVLPGWRFPLLALAFSLVAGSTVTYSTWRGNGHDLDAALVQGVRVLVIAWPGSVTLSYLDPSRLGDHLAQDLRLPARFVAAFGSSLQRVTTLTHAWGQLERSRRARGLGPAWNRPLGVLRWAVTMAFALLVHALRGASRTAVAMDARGFADADDRTWALPARWTRADRVVVVASVVLGLVPVVVWLLSR